MTFMCPTVDDVNSHYVVEAVPARILPVKLLFFPLQLINICQHGKVRLRRRSQEEGLRRGGGDLAGCGKGGSGWSFRPEANLGRVRSVHWLQVPRRSQLRWSDGLQR